MQPDSYPFAIELATDTEGQVGKVVLSVEDYHHLIGLLENQGLALAIQEAIGEKSLSQEEALRELEQS